MNNSFFNPQNAIEKNYSRQGIKTRRDTKEKEERCSTIFTLKSEKNIHISD